jgi:chemotaxis signal transduction protein
MGMDIVKRIVDQLGGELLLKTQPGEGSTFTLRIPLSITIVDAFSFTCGKQPFVVPVATIEEIVEVDPGRLVRAPGGRDVRLLQRRGETVPLLALESVLQMERGREPRRKALIVRRNTEPYGFEVDRMLGQQEVVVRPLEDPLVHVPGVTGSTDLGDGLPTLVLDLLSLRVGAPRDRPRHDLRGLRVAGGVSGGCRRAADGVLQGATIVPGVAAHVAAGCGARRVVPASLRLLRPASRRPPRLAPGGGQQGTARSRSWSTAHARCSSSPDQLSRRRGVSTTDGFVKAVAGGRALDGDRFRK